MRPFRYVRAYDEDQAMKAGTIADASFVGGGTNMVDLMRLDVMRPQSLVDITGVPLDKIEVGSDGVVIGAMVRNTALAYHPAILERYPVLSEALLSGASPQIRNMATVGGNLLQRTRCPYFRDTASPCNKRERGSGCAAIEGYTRSHAVLGTSEHCIATHPSDMCVALVALDAKVRIRGEKGSRVVPITEFHTLPGDRPDVENVLAHGELVTHVEVPATAFAQRSRYVKIRDRAQFAFALASVAAALEIRDRKIRDARVALGGVATKPWRAREVEGVLVGAMASLDTYRRAADAAMSNAKGRRDNAFKIELARRTIVRALGLAGGAL